MRREDAFHFVLCLLAKTVIAISVLPANGGSSSTEVKSLPPALLLPKEKSFFQEAAIKIIKLYQKFPLLKFSSCKYHPTCSNYGLRAIEDYGFLVGHLMTFDRIQRCNPFTAAGSIDLPEEHYIFSSAKPVVKDSLRTCEVDDFTSVAISSISNRVDGSNAILSFAESLFAEGDYFRAITEYKRFIYFSDDIRGNNFAYFRIGECYYRLKEFTRAKDVFKSLVRNKELGDDFNLRAMFYIGKIYYKEGQYFLARCKFKDVIENCSSKENDNPFLTDAHLYIGLTFLKERLWEEASEEFCKIASGGTVSKEVLLGKKLKRKSPAIAGVLSIIPGLGKIYAGVSKDGIFSFISISLLGYLTYEIYSKNKNWDLASGMLAILSLSYYFGNIYGSVDAARLYNNKQEEKFIGRIESEVDKLLNWKVKD